VLSLCENTFAIYSSTTQFPREQRVEPRDQWTRGREAESSQAQGRERSRGRRLFYRRSEGGAGTAVGTRWFTLRRSLPRFQLRSPSRKRFMIVQLPLIRSCFEEREFINSLTPTWNGEEKGADQTARIGKCYASTSQVRIASISRSGPSMPEMKTSALIRGRSQGVFVTQMRHFPPWWVRNAAANSSAVRFETLWTTRPHRMLLFRSA